MPRTDVHDTQSYTNFQGIDVRKNCDQNTALDACNVYLDSRYLLTNIPLPSYYPGSGYPKQLEYKDATMFACQFSDLYGNEYDIDITFYEGAPTITSVIRQAESEDGFHRIDLCGSCLASVRDCVCTAPGGMAYMHGPSFFFTCAPDGSKLEIYSKDTVQSGSEFFITSPFGAIKYKINV